MTFALHPIKMESCGEADLTTLTVITGAAVICAQLPSAPILTQIKVSWRGEVYDSADWDLYLTC